MNCDTIITVKTPKLPIDRFEMFMSATTEQLKENGRNNPQYYRSQDGERFEPIVVETMRSLANEFSFSPDLIVRTERQHFPDILAERYFGVEVKTTKSNTWRSTGSSIVEGLRDEHVKRIYMMFGKLSEKEIDFRCKPYEQCLDDIYVTHSPRYQIDMDIKAPTTTIFEKLDISYDDFRQSNNQIKIVKDYYRERYKNKGKEMPWWIDEEQIEMPFMPKMLNSSSVKLLNGLSTQETSYLEMCAYILFPEILGTDKDKYQNFALWLCSRHSVISPNIRDFFTANGKINIIVNGTMIYRNAPRILGNFLCMTNKIHTVFESKNDVYHEIPYYSSFYDETDDVYEAWKNAVKKFLTKTLAKSNLSMEWIFNVENCEKSRNEIRIETR